MGVVSTTVPVSLGLGPQVSSRLSDSPAMVVTSHEQASMQRVMKQMAMMQGKAMCVPFVPQTPPRHTRGWC